MKNLSVVCLTILLFRCGTSTAPPKLPASASFGWNLKDLTETRQDAAPDTIRSLGITRSWRAGYAGPGVANVDIYATKAGLEMMQRWRPQAQTVALFNTHYFVVVHWQSANQSAATALVGQIERSFPHSD